MSLDTAITSGYTLTMFVGRQTELEFLQESVRSTKSALIPIYGRRRVGKSELILQLLRNHPGIYYVGKTAPAGLQKAEFCREAARALDDTLIEELASRDTQTGFFNRHTFMERLEAC